MQAQDKDKRLRDLQEEVEEFRTSRDELLEKLDAAEANVSILDTMCS